MKIGPQPDSTFWNIWEWVISSVNRRSRSCNKPQKFYQKLSLLWFGKRAVSHYSKTKSGTGSKKVSQNIPTKRPSWPKCLQGIQKCLKLGKIWPKSPTNQLILSSLPTPSSPYIAWTLSHGKFLSWKVAQSSSPMPPCPLFRNRRNFLKSGSRGLPSNAVQQLCSWPSLTGKIKVTLEGAVPSHHLCLTLHSPIPAFTFKCFVGDPKISPKAKIIQRSYMNVSTSLYFSVFWMII